MAPRKTSTAKRQSTPTLSPAPEAPTSTEHRIPARSPSSDEVARRAYELFLARGGEHGHDLEDWLQAERELASPTARA